MRQRVLAMYITAQSGHYQAARALEQAIRSVNPAAETLTIDAFQYLNPVLARIVDRMYLSVIQNAPEIWDYLYDNPKVVHRSDSFRKLLHRYDSPRLHGLLEDFRPDVIACTQAFPCGLVADFKEEQDLSTPLYGILTDFSPHTYWVHSQVNGYVVPAGESRQWLLDRQVEPDRVWVFGIPIDPAFAESPDVQAIRRRLQLAPEAPVILLMGGGQGLGPIVEVVEQMDRIHQDFQLLAIAGTNESLYHKLITRAPALKHPMQVFGHVDFVADLMSVSSFIITKTGGLTTSEALAKGLPILALEPIPGQETKNAAFLVKEKAACLVKDFRQLALSVQQLLDHPNELAALAANARRLGKPQAALDAARLVVGA